MARGRSAHPPAYAWDWLTRQRVVWTEIVRRLAPPAAPTGPHPQVPDWSDLLDRPPGAGDEHGTRDWSTLRTRTEVFAALRADYATDPRVRAATDGAVADLAFLGRLDVPLTARGVGAAPRGMRWWWDHLGGAGADADARPDLRPASPASRARSAARGRSEARTEPATSPTSPLQLRLVDVQAGYGDRTRTVTDTTTGAVVDTATETRRR